MRDLGVFFHLCIRIPFLLGDLKYEECQRGHTEVYEDLMVAEGASEDICYKRA